MTDKEDLYTIIHLGLGGLSTQINEPIMDTIFLIYQFAQLVLNIRIFFLDGEIKEGNSLNITIKKIGSYYIGKIIANTYK